ncbi:MAG TPA: hypothetical protein PKE29_05235 [Phycisphaerales bacterium]|nr:hypothetical protein [Phycisphaerales bacterium]
MNAPSKGNPGTPPSRTPIKPANWIRGIKFRALAWLVAIILAAVATVVLAGVPAWPMIGVAVAAACVSVGKLTTRLLKPTCLECGHDLSGQPIGTQGIACPECGAVNSPGLVQLAQMGDPQGTDADKDDKEPLA